VELDPNNPEAHVAMGAAYLQSNRSDDAIAELLAALMIDPRRTSAAAALGQAYLRTGDYAGAAAAARRAVTGDPTLAEARYTLATSLARLGRADEAKQEFARYQGMLAEAQANRRRDFELAKLMRDVRDSVGRGDLDDAIARLRDAILIKPDDGALHVSLGLFLRESGRLPEAAASLEQALALNADPGLHRHLAEIYADLGRPEDAARHRAVVDGGRADAR
jgi:tetratricopeptide (TPR) repeat protein